MSDHQSLLLAKQSGGVKINAGTTGNSDPPEKEMERKERQNKVSRVTVRLTGEMGRAIDEVADVTGASSPSEVVRRAITIYHTLVQQKLSGNDTVVIVKDGDKEKKIPVFL